MQSVGRAATILCVEDEESALTLRKTILEQNGFFVLAAHTAAQALALFRANPIGLVIADHMLRGESGLALAAEIKRLKPTVPIVMLSGATPESMNDIDCFIQKTEPISSVLAIVHDLIGRSRS